MNNNSNDVKQLLARVCIHLARNISPEKMSSELLKALLPMLVNGTKEKNGYVKANSELALIAVLRLRQGEEEHQVCFYIIIKPTVSYNHWIIIIPGYYSFKMKYVLSEMHGFLGRWCKRVIVGRCQQSTTQGFIPARRQDRRIR